MAFHLRYLIKNQIKTIWIYESNDSIRSDGFSFEVFMQNKTGLAFYKN